MKQRICVDCPMPILGRSPAAIRCKACARKRMKEYNKNYYNEYMRKRKNGS